MAETWQQAHEAGNRAFSGGLFDAALSNYTQAVELARRCKDPEYLTDALRGLAKTYLQLGRVDEAVQAAQEAEATDREFWGFENQQLLESMYLLAEGLRRQGTVAQSRELFERVLQARVMMFGERHELTLEVLVHMIWLELEQPGISRSLHDLAAKAIEIFSLLHPSGSFTKALNIQALLKPYLDQNRQQEATALSSKIEQVLREVGGDARSELRHALSDSSSAMRNANKPMAAWHLQARADQIEKREAASQPANPWAQSLSEPVKLVEGVPVIEEQSNIDLAKENARRAAAAASAADSSAAGSVVLGAQAALSSQDLLAQGNKALTSGLYDVALTSFLAARESAVRVDDKSAASEALRHLARLYLDIGRVAEAEKAAAEAAQIDRAFWGADNTFLCEDEFLHAESLRRLKKYARAKGLFQHVFSIRAKLFNEAHDESIAALIKLIWIDLEESDSESLSEHLQQATDLFFSRHRNLPFVQLLKVKQLLQPYVDAQKQGAVESICKMIQRACRNCSNFHFDEMTELEDDCRSCLKAVGVLPPSVPPAGLPAATASSAPAGSPAPGSASGSGSQAQRQPNQPSAPSLQSLDTRPVPGAYQAPPDDGVQVSREEPDEDQSQQPGEDERHIGESGSPTVPPPVIAARPPASASAGYLGVAVTLSGLNISTDAFVFLLLGTATAIGVMSVLLYMGSGHFMLFEPFAAGALAVLTVTFSCLMVAISLRQGRLTAQLPGTLEILVSLLRAGEPIMDAIEQVSRTAPDPLRGEFARLLESIKGGKSLKQAFVEMKRSVAASEIDYLADAVRTNRTAGGNLAEAVATIAKDLRDKERDRLLMSKARGIAKIAALLLMLQLSGYLIALTLNPAFGSVALSAVMAKLVLIGAFAVISFLIATSMTASQATEQASKSDIVAGIVAFCEEQNKRDRMRDELSKFLDLVIVHVQAGASLPGAFQKVSHDARASCPTLSKELEESLSNMTSFKFSVPNALKKIGETYDITEFRTLAGTIEASAQLGGNISYQLKQQSDALRDHLAKTRRARAASLFSVAMAIGVAIAVIIQIAKSFAH